MLDYIGEEDKQRENVIGGFHLRSTSMEDVALLRPVALDLLALDYKYLQQDHWANATTAANSSFAVAKI